jgi:hypothetical protein
MIGYNLLHFQFESHSVPNVVRLIFVSLDAFPYSPVFPQLATDGLKETVNDFADFS